MAMIMAFLGVGVVALVYIRDGAVIASVAFTEIMVGVRFGFFSSPKFDTIFTKGVVLWDT